MAQNLFLAVEQLHEYANFKEIGLLSPFRKAPQKLQYLSPRFQKKCFLRSQVSRKAPTQSALESTDPGASNGGSNFGIQPLEADMLSFEVAGLSQY